MTSEDADGGCSVLKGEEGGAWRAATFVVAGENFCGLPFEGGDPGDVGCCGNATEPKSLREGRSQLNPGTGFEKMVKRMLYMPLNCLV